MIIVNPNHRNPSPQAAIEPPIWCAYVAACTSDNPVIVDAEALGYTLDVTDRRIGTKTALLVAMGANPSASSTPKMGVVEELQKLIPFSIVTGLHTNALGGHAHPLAYRWERLTPRWDLVDFSKYRAHNWHCLHDLNSRDGYGVIYTSFGCPFDCSYCNIHALYKTREVAYREPEAVRAEVEYLVSQGVKNLKIADELFTLKPSHVEAICNVLKPFNLNIWCYGRGDCISPDMLATMKDAGINWIAYGFEAPGLKYDAQEAVRMTREADINVLGNFMFGLPGDTFDKMWATFDLARDLQCDWVNFYCTTAYPGSQLYEDTPKEDLPERWEDYDQYSPTFKPLKTKYLTSQEIRDFRDTAFGWYFSYPPYQDMIHNKFGQQAVDHINEMLQWRIRDEKLPGHDHPHRTKVTV